MSEGEVVVHEVTYPHPPERVWHALVDQRDLSAWLMDNDFVPVVGGWVSKLGELLRDVLAAEPS